MSSRWRGELVRHPASPESPIERIFVAVERLGTDVTIAYEIVGDIAQITIPEPAPSQRRDGLWTATCFELFVRRRGADGYFEWNFAPSTAWAAYAFDGYRAGMRNADVRPPTITTEATGDRYRLTVTATIDTAAWDVGLSAVIRHTDGGTSYWALAHPPGKPDFHHADCFAAELAPSRNS